MYAGGKTNTVVNSTGPNDKTPQLFSKIFDLLDRICCYILDFGTYLQVDESFEIKFEFSYIFQLFCIYSTILYYIYF